MLELLPLVQVRVARALFRQAERSHGRDVRQEVADITNEVLLTLLADRGRVLRRWDERRGLSFEAFVGFVAEREVASLLRTARRSPWTEDPTLDENLEVSDEGDFELRVESHDLLERLLDRLSEVLSPMGMHLFELLQVSQLDVQEVCSETGLSREAVYAWRSRLAKVARSLRDEFKQEEDAERAGPAPTSGKVGGL